MRHTGNPAGCQQTSIDGTSRQGREPAISGDEPGKNPIVQVSGPDQPILQVERQHHLGGSLIKRPALAGGRSYVVETVQFSTTSATVPRAEAVADSIAATATQAAMRLAKT
jgi:hypothetical protein